MADDADAKPKRTAWHRFLGQSLRLSLGRVQVQVETELAITSDPPRIDVVLLRRETDTWTEAQRAMLPDGVRDTDASDILLEFKYSESLTQDAILQAAAYEYFYRTGHNLTANDVQIFILCSKTPQAARLAEFEYEITNIEGVYRSQNRYISHITLLVLNELRAESHNALVKAFASRKVEKNKAFSLLNQSWQLSSEMWSMLDGLQALWSLPEGANMNEELTIERVMAIGEQSKRILLENLPAEELYTYIDPSYREELEQKKVEQGIEQGIEQGRKTQQIDTLEQILQTRFGNVTEEISMALTNCTLDQLQTLVNSSLDSADLDAFLADLPNPAEDETGAESQPDQDHD